MSLQKAQLRNRVCAGRYQPNEDDRNSGMSGESVLVDVYHIEDGVAWFAFTTKGEIFDALVGDIEKFEGVIQLIEK